MRSLLRHALACVVILGFAAAPAGAQPPADQNSRPGPVRQLSADEAVRLALEQNLGIQIQRFNPQIQDVAISQAKAFWSPSLNTSFTNNSQDSPPTSIFSGGQSKVVDARFTTVFGVNQVLPTGGNYSFGWNSYRATSTNIFNNFDPLLSSNLSFSASQPLLKNFKIDSVRQQLETTKKDRESADLQVASTVALTTRNVKNAYFDLAFQIDNLKAQQQSLDLAKRLLADNEKRVQIGTMAPIDIVEAQSEVARNEEAVIVAESGIGQAEDRLRALIFNPSSPDFWDVRIEPTDSVPYNTQTVDVSSAVRRALERRTDVQLARTSLARSEISIKFFRNQTLPEVNAQASYASNAVGGTVLSPLTSFPVGGLIDRSIVSERGFGSVLGDVVTNAFPAWSYGLSVTYPLGTNPAQANLARAKLQLSQANTEMRNLELQVTTEVRDAARQVVTNGKRVDSARAARELAARRLEAEEKKFAAGIQISFFVFQAQRDLAQARTSEIRAIADYNKSLVDFEAVQETSLTGGTGALTSASTGTVQGLGSLTVPR
ncbi:MAG TPA: TolC family protein [Vicinamibacterales bacterium]|jgi:outer membrane protein TolC